MKNIQMEKFDERIVRKCSSVPLSASVLHLDKKLLYYAHLVGLWLILAYD